MKVQGYTKYCNELKSAINTKIQYFEPIKNQIIQYVSEPDSSVFIDMICKELEKAFLSKFSHTVNRATIIFSELAYLDKEQLTQRMAQKQFQQNLLFTMRRRTSKIGNRFTMHPLLWSDIEIRVMKVYEFWNKKYMAQEEKYHNILENYRFLKSKVKIPEEILNEMVQKENINQVVEIQQQHKKIEQQTNIVLYDKKQIASENVNEILENYFPQGNK